MRFLIFALVLAVLAFALQAAAISCELKSIKLKTSANGAVIFTDVPSTDNPVHEVTQRFDSPSVYVDVDFANANDDYLRTILVSVNGGTAVNSTDDRVTVSGLKTACSGENTISVAVAQYAINPATYDSCRYRYLIKADCE